MKTLTILVSLLVLPVNVWAQSFRVLNDGLIVRQGGVLIVKLAEGLENRNLKFHIFKHNFPFDNRGLAFIGVQVNEEPRNYIAFLVEDKKGYTEQFDFYYVYIRVSEVQRDEPWYAGKPGRVTEKVKRQRAEESVIKNKAYNSADLQKNYAIGEYEYPLKTAEITDQFGTPRVYGSINKKTKKIEVAYIIPHGGVDFRARTPLRVKAINSGKVLLARNFPLRGTEGKMLVIDHGSGILSIYLHLSKFKVKAGDKVKKGDAIALTGATPIGTAPHLHLMIRVNGVNVDPIDFIDTMNEAIAKGKIQ